MKNIYLTIFFIFLIFGCDSSTEPRGTVEGTVTDIDGNEYKTVKIGNQIWMAENLRVTHYRNGDPIPNVINNTEWSRLNTGVRASYHNDQSMSEIYGLLYNWYAVGDERGLCPEGWRVATNADWHLLVQLAGGAAIAGGPLKSRGIVEEGTGLWRFPNTGATNSTLFSALPADFRRTSGAFQDSLGFYTYFWTSTEFSETNAWERRLYYGSTGVGNPNNRNKRNGKSVRCIKIDS